MHKAKGRHTACLQQAAILSCPSYPEVKDPTSRMAGLVLSWTKALR